MISRIVQEFRSLIGDNASLSLLSRKESTAIKGFLMLLIVLGHNKYMMEGGYCNRFLYSFHVYCFYFLPFLYNFSFKPIGKLITDNLRRLYIPYIAVFALLTIIAYIQNVGINYILLFKAFVCGTQHTLGDAFGFGSFLWFIPTMFSVLLFRWIYYNSGNSVRLLMFIASVVCLCGFAYMWTWSVWLWWYSPISLYIGLAMIAPALVCRYLFAKNISSQSLGIGFFILILAVLIVYPLDQLYLYLTINRILCPTLILLFLLTFRDKLAKISLIENIGILSFQIYLIHIFVYNAFYAIIDKTDFQNLYTGMVIYPVVLVISYYLAKIPVLKYIFLK